MTAATFRDDGLIDVGRRWPWVRQERLTVAQEMIDYLREKNVELIYRVVELESVLEGFRPMAELLDRAMSEKGPESPSAERQAEGVSEDPESVSDDSETSQAP